MTTTSVAANPVRAKLTVPGPRPMPLLGSAGNMMGFISDPVAYTTKLFKEYGPVVALSANGGTNFYTPEPDCPGSIFIYGPELVRQATTQHEIYYKYPLTGKLYAKRNQTARTEPLKHFLVGLFGVNSDEHRQHRRMLMPAFHKKRIETYRDDMVRLTQSTLDSLKIGEQCNIAEVLRLLTAHVATTTLFGTDIGEEGTEAAQTLQDALAVLGQPLTSLLPFDVPGLPYHHFLDLIQRFDTEMRAIIARKRASNYDGGDVLSMLLLARDAESGAVLSEEEVLGHTGVIFAAGHETSNNALAWTLLLLSQHPQIAADLLDELEGVLHGEPPTIEQLSQLPLLERVIKESMRLIPPAPLNWRAISQATEIGGYRLPANTEVYVSIYHTHHMVELYDQPEKFDPQRWETISPTVFEYNPFSAGPRMCIGATFAMLEIKIVLAMLLQRYRLQCLPQSKVDRFGLITIAPKGGLHIVVHKQDRRFDQGVGGIHGTVRDMVSLPA